MKLTLGRMFLLLTTMAMIASCIGQLIIDNDDPNGHKIVLLLLNAIDRQENGHFSLDRIVFTLGAYPKYHVQLIVINKDNNTKLSCYVDLFENEQKQFSTGKVLCKVPN